MKRTMVSLGLCLAIASCVAPGDFCDVVPGPIEFEAATAREVVRTDRPAAEQIRAQNLYGDAACGW